MQDKSPYTYYFIVLYNIQKDGILKCYMNDKTMFEIINTKKYVSWTIACFIEEMKSFHANRTNVMLNNILEKENITLYEAVRQIDSREGPAYDLFVSFNEVGGDSFFQEILTCLSLVDFYDRNNVQSVAFPVKTDCPEDVSLIDLKKQIESNTEYDFLIKKKDGLFLKIQLKTVPERYLGEFDSKYFIENILSLTSKYNDVEMLLVYLLQPSIKRISMDKLNIMIDDICHKIGSELPIKNIYLVWRKNIQVFEYIQVYKDVENYEVKIEDTIINEVKTHIPF